MLQNDEERGWFEKVAEGGRDCWMLQNTFDTFKGNIVCAQGVAKPPSAFAGKEEWLGCKQVRRRDSVKQVMEKCEVDSPESIPPSQSPAGRVLRAFKTAGPAGRERKRRRSSSNSSRVSGFQAKRRKTEKDDS